MRTFYAIEGARQIATSGDAPCRNNALAPIALVVFSV